jgi:hypothetical protein
MQVTYVALCMLWVLFSGVMKVSNLYQIFIISLMSIMDEIMHIMNIIKLIMKLYTFYRDIKFSLKAIMSNLHLVFSRRWAKSRRWNDDFVRVATYSILESEGCFIHSEPSFTCALLLDGKRDSHDPSVA